MGRFIVWGLSMIGIVLLCSTYLPREFAMTTYFVLAGIHFTGWLITVIAGGVASASLLKG